MLIQELSGKKLTDYYKENLWEKLGMQDSAEWVLDNSGMEMALGGLNMTMRDFAKVGLLYAHGGKFYNEQLVSEEWVKLSTTPDAPHLMPGKRDNAYHEQGYGFQWWIPKNNEGDFFANGIYDQYIYVNPLKNMVIVLLSANYKYTERNLAEEHRHVALFKTIAKQL